MFDKEQLVHVLCVRVHKEMFCVLMLQVKQKGGTVEQIVIADMAFDVLKNAWGKFESGELRK